MKTAQIGKCGELLVQYQLLMKGVESAHLTTDSGIDLVAYSPKNNRPITIQVKTNLKPKAAGGKGKQSLDWWVPIDSPAQYAALVDLSTQSIWLMEMAEMAALAQQTSRGRFHLYMYTDLSVKPTKTNRPIQRHEFAKFSLDSRLSEIFG